jgi:hypothetical protein
VYPESTRNHITLDLDVCGTVTPITDEEHFCWNKLVREAARCLIPMQACDQIKAWPQTPYMAPAVALGRDRRMPLTLAQANTCIFIIDELPVTSLQWPNRKLGEEERRDQSRVPDGHREVYAYPQEPIWIMVVPPDGHRDVEWRLRQGWECVEFRAHVDEVMEGKPWTAEFSGGQWQDQSCAPKMDERVYIRTEEEDEGDDHITVTVVFPDLDRYKAILELNVGEEWSELRRHVNRMMKGKPWRAQLGGTLSASDGDTWKGWRPGYRLRGRRRRGSSLLVCLGSKLRRWAVPRTGRRCGELRIRRGASAQFGYVPYRSPGRYPVQPSTPLGA